jgi:hypothetical protein
MLTGLRSRLTYANVMATLAVFVALGGTSVAAVSLKRNAVKEKNIAPNAVTTPKVKNGTLLVQDFAPGQLPRGQSGEAGARGAPGEQGTPGEHGAQGERGPQGDRGLQGERGLQGVQGVGQQGIQGERGPGAVPIVFEVPGGTLREVATVGPWTIIADCFAGSSTTALTVRARGPGTAQIAGMTATDDGTPTPVTAGAGLATSFNTDLLFVVATVPQYKRLALDIQLQSGAQTATVSVNGLADRRGAAPGTCGLWGTGVPAL